MILTVGSISLLALAGLILFSWEPASTGVTSDFFSYFHNPQLDPSIGTEVPLDIEPPLPEAAARILLIGIGVCSECTARKLDPKPLRGKFARIIGVFQGEREDYLGESEEQYIEAFDQAVFMPPKSFSVLNSSWVPRAYVLDYRGHLLDLQEPGEDIHKFIGEWAQ